MRLLPFCILHCAFCIAALAAQPPAPPPASAIVPGPLHSATNLAPAEARAALASALPAPGTNAVAALLAPDAPALPAFETSGWWVDAVALPLGLHEVATGATMATPSDALLCLPEHARAIVWRWRRGTAPRAVPLDLEHASAGGAEGYALMGRVVGAWFDETRGAVFRVELTPTGRAAVESGWLHLSPELTVLTATTTVNAAIGVEGADRLSIPWALRSLALTRTPALPTPALSAADLRPLSEISVYPRAR